MADELRTAPMFDTFEGALAWFQARVPVTDEEAKAMGERARDRAFWAAGASQIAQVEALQKSLAVALTEGQSMDQWRKGARETLKDSTDQHLNNVFRTNMQSAYSAGRQQQIFSPDNLRRRPYGMIQTVDDDRRTDTCSGFAGTIMPLDDPGWATRTPPFHYQCRTTIRTLTAREAERRGGATGWPDVMPEPGFGKGAVRAGATALTEEPDEPLPVAPVTEEPPPDAVRTDLTDRVKQAQDRLEKLQREADQARAKREQAKRDKQLAEDLAKGAKQRQETAPPEVLPKVSKDVVRYEEQAKKHATTEKLADAVEAVTIVEARKVAVEVAKADTQLLVQALKEKRNDSPVEQKRLAVNAIVGPEREDFFRTRAEERAGGKLPPKQQTPTERRVKSAERAVKDLEEIIAVSKGKAKSNAKAKLKERQQELDDAIAARDLDVKGAVKSTFAPRPKVEPLPTRVDGRQALRVEQIDEFESSHEAIKNWAEVRGKDDRRAVRNLIRHHVPLSSRDLAHDLPGANKLRVAEDALGRNGEAAGTHSWDGQINLNKKTGEMLDEALSLIGKGKASELQSTHWSAIRTVVHEEIHGMSPVASREGLYSTKMAINTEEAFTEILARRVMRQMGEDVYGVPQIAMRTTSGSWDLGTLPANRKLGLEQAGAYSDVIGDVVEVFDGDIAALESAILHARRPRGEADLNNLTSDTQLKEALSTLGPEKAAKAYEKLSKLWQEWQ